jgi:hypothetical protein
MNETKPERVICLIAGKSGVGKSFFIANLRNALIYDTDIGEGLGAYKARMARNGSIHCPVDSYLEILDDLGKRRAESGFEDILTVAIDHVTGLQQQACLRYNPTGAADYGRSNNMANAEWRRIREFCKSQDFNLICVAHLKAEYEKQEAIGVIADGAKNIEGDMSIVLQLRRAANYPSTAWVQKWRRDPEDIRGEIPSLFPFTIEAFEKLAGQGMFSPREPIKIASADQVAKLTKLLEVAKLPEGTEAKWLKKAGVESFSEMAGSDVDKCIAFIEKTLKFATNGKDKQHGLGLQSA